MNSFNGPLTYEGHVLPIQQLTQPALGHGSHDWPSIRWRVYIVWELAELGFRDDLLTLDLIIRDVHPSHKRIGEADPIQRFGLICGCWGSSGLKTGSGENWLCSADKDRRLRGLLSFYELMASWPRASEHLPLWYALATPEQRLELAAGTPDSDKMLYELELSVWKCFIQTYFPASPIHAAPSSRAQSCRCVAHRSNERLVP